MKITIAKYKQQDGEVDRCEMRQLCREDENSRDRSKVHRDHVSILPAATQSILASLFESKS